MRATFLVTDIDGTITNAQGFLHTQAVAEMQSLERAGVCVGLVSGRPYPAVRVLGEYLGLTGPLIAENGGIGFFDGTEWVLGSKQPVEEVVSVLARLMPIQPTWDTRYRGTDYALDRTIDAERIREVLIDSGFDVELHVSSIMIHIAKKGVTKRAGLERCLEVANITHEAVVVAGDADSDLSLFEGFSVSIAPANCTKPIAGLASYRASASFGEGFCEAISHLRHIGILPCL